MTNPKRILITGCAGFIGSNFVRQFRKKFQKTKIIGVDDFSTGREDALDSSVIFYKGSILDERLLEKIFSKHKPEYVFHFAALPRVSFSVEHPRHTSEVNIIGTVALLEASKNHNVFGPGQYGDSPYSTVVSAWLESVYFPKKKKAFIEGDGNQSRDFCYVDNVVLANILAMKSKRKFSGEALNIAYGSQIKINEVKKLIEKLSDKSIKLEKRPPRLGDVKHTHADISKARKLLSYNPQVDFEEGLKRTIQPCIRQEELNR